MWFRKTSPEERREESEDREIVREGNIDSEDHSPKNVCSEEDYVEDSDVDIDMLQDAGSDDDDYSGKADVDDSCCGDSATSEVGRKKKQTSHLARRFGARWSKRLAGGTAEPFVENRNLGTKNILRQRPTRNSALESIVIPDSDDDS